MPEKLTADEITRAINAGEGLGANPKARYLFQMLASVRGHGPRADKLKGIADEVYVYAPTERNTFSVKPRNPKDTRTKGDTRLAKLARGDGSFVPLEAQHFFEAFVSVMGQEWSSLITPRELVLSDIRDIIRLGNSKGLPWPEEITPLATLEILSLSDSSHAPKVQIIECGSFGIMSGITLSNSDLYTASRDKQLASGDRVMLKAQDIPSNTKEIFVFVAAGQEMNSTNSNSAFGLLSFGLRDFEGASDAYFGPNSGDQDSFLVEAASGRYGLGIVCSSTVGSLSSCLPNNSKATRWTLEDCRDFIKAIRIQRLEQRNPDSVALSTYSVIG